MASSSSSAITAADPRQGLFLAALLASACARPDVAPVNLATAEPEIRVGVAVNAPALVLGGGPDALRLEGGDGSGPLLLPAGVSVTASPGPGGVEVRQGADRVLVTATLTVVPAESAGPVRLEGREYRGQLVITPGPGGLLAANRLGLEQYLVGVVGAEMGRRGEADRAALEAQAVVSRTFAVRALGRWRLRGYDLLATVADQAYAGIPHEYPLAGEAVRTTRGEVLTWEGRLIDAFFHSTCGGRTAEGTESFSGAAAPYLVSIPDEDASGRAWCAISPRWRWRAEWKREELVRTLRSTLPATGGVAGLADGVTDIRVLERTPSGRVARMEAVGRAGRHEVRGYGVRQLLRPGDATMLRSALFELEAWREGGTLVRLAAMGAGAGHGVGMCQWGALGRSRSGHSYRAILSAYFPGTDVTRTY